ncbi:MAG: NAD+ synthase [Pseudohongiellaceae bacterium]
MNANKLTVVMAQLNPLVGDIRGNTALVIKTVRQAVSEFNADMVVFSELMLTAYPPEDLLLRPSLDLRIEKALSAIMAEQFPVYVVLGHPGSEGERLYNMLSVIRSGEVLASYRKQCLPNYQVFDEKRYFSSGNEPCVLDISGLKVAFSICEDLWESGPMLQAAAAGAGLMVNINGSPFHKNKLHERQAILRQRAGEGNMPIIYVNQAGGQDELVFDGGSMAVDESGRVRVLAPQFETQLTPVVLEMEGDAVARIEPGSISPALPLTASVYQALVLGVRDYINKNGFRGVVLGLSGGIDSALSLAVAVDALGSERVHAVMMPFRYTSRMSIEDAETEARNLQVAYRVIPIEPIYDSFMRGLADEFEGTSPDLTEQNIQARCRGVILMAISNKKGLLVLTTGNKSEMAVGYSTLYGDMAGGFDVLKDVSKMMVYELARFRNEQYAGQATAVIPQRVIDRPPSAELAPGQVDEDNLPPYPVLDKILELYIEQDYSANAIIESGFDHATVHKVLRLVDQNEYKRRQAPIGVRISKRGFGRDRRYPVTSGWELGE